MKKLLLGGFIFLLIFPQEPLLDLDRLLKTKNLEDVIMEVQAFLEKHKGTPQALYLEAVVETNAEKAVEKYKRLIMRFPNSDQADDALYRTAQYYFSRGLYISARRYFLNLIEKYPDSPYLDDAKYFAAACLFASEKFNSCRTELKNFLFHYPRSPFTKLAKEDLKVIKLNQNLGFIDTKAFNHNSKGKYTLQIGAFSQINNALNQRNYISKLGLPVEIREKTRGNTTLYLVWVGSFKTKKAAQNFGKKFKRDYGKPYRIVERAEP